ncbi:MAG TPA: hypothetical protein VFY10_04820, partial [Dehalococcoidia bacterium]|nr:hypothetical protein [Dehalococcoidia bacterium]
PGAAGSSGAPGPDTTPAAETTPDAQQQLQQALQGLGSDITYEQAVHILDLLRQQQQRALQAPNGSTGPDY